ncbi:MAG: hypothetical protein JNJ60_13450, partial [Rhodocyclaceae bacterium]|nr:hypothetical protein [Rhodocyclaceae bacterium]
MNEYLQRKLRMLRHGLQILAALALCITAGQPDAYAQSHWLIDNTQVGAVPSYKEFDRGTPFDHNAPPGKSLLEVRGSLNVDEGAVFGPFKLTDIAISSVDERGRLWRETAVAIGNETATKHCTYMSTRLPANSSMHVDLKSGGALQLDRDAADEAPIFTTNARNLRLCMIFETDGAVPDKLVLELPGKIIPIVNSSLSPDTEAVRKALREHPQTTAQRMKFWAVSGVLGLTVLLGVGLLARGLLTERSNIMPQDATLKLYEKRPAPEVYALAPGHEV